MHAISHQLLEPETCIEEIKVSERRMANESFLRVSSDFFAQWLDNELVYLHMWWGLNAVGDRIGDVFGAQQWKVDSGHCASIEYFGIHAAGTDAL